MDLEKILKSFDKVVKNLKDIVEDQTIYENIISKMKLDSVENNNIYILCQNSFSKEIINNYLKKITFFINEELNANYNVIIVTSNEKKSVDVKENNIFNKKFTFENFIVNESNEKSFTIAKKIFENNFNLNPILFVGNVGSGKTHLLYAIANEYNNKFPNKKIKYIESEDFVRDVLNSFSTQTTEKLKDDYLNLDILLIDDIQFLSKKEKTNEIFFYIFNKLIEKEKFIIMASDTQIDKLNSFEERMKSRFSSGLVIKIEKYSSDAIKKIIKKKIEYEYNDLCSISDEALEYMSNRSDGDIRKLCGFLKTIFFNIENEKIKNITVDIIKKYLDIESNDNFNIKPEIIISKICSLLNVDQKSVISNNKIKKNSEVRHICMLMIRQKTNMTYAQIGNLFSNRSHVTVMEGIEKAKKIFSKDSNLKDYISKNIETI
ncbi:MAG: ATP-binding protein [Mycoplasmataceae bacterium]|jgi:chromosomal replication initiator protein|nr:ATP-binding protein [Mycoplasmataceae bacterium]